MRCREIRHRHPARLWTAAGIVFGNRATPGTLQAGVQVLVRTPDGTFLETYTDARGRFVFLPGMTIPMGSRAGIRTANVQRLMPTDLEAANCMNAGCHQNGDGNAGQLSAGP